MATEPEEPEVDGRLRPLPAGSTRAVRLPALRGERGGRRSSLRADTEPAVLGGAAAAAPRDGRLGLARRRGDGRPDGGRARGATGVRIGEAIWPTFAFPLVTTRGLRRDSSAARRHHSQGCSRRSRETPHSLVRHPRAPKPGALRWCLCLCGAQGGRVRRTPTQLSSSKPSLLRLTAQRGLNPPSFDPLRDMDIADKENAQVQQEAADPGSQEGQRQEQWSKFGWNVAPQSVFRLDFTNLEKVLDAIGLQIQQQEVKIHNPPWLEGVPVLISLDRTR